MERRGAKRVYAIDIAPPNHFGFNKIHKLPNSTVQFVHTPVYQLPTMFNPYSMDAIMLNVVFYHLRHPLMALDAVYTILKPGGVLFVESAAAFAAPSDELGKGNHEYSWTQICANCFNDKTNVFFPTMEALKFFISSSGFTILSTKAEGHGIGSRLAVWATKYRSKRRFELEGYPVTDEVRVVPVMPQGMCDLPF